MTGYGPTKALAKNLDDSRQAELKEAFIAFHDGYRTELGITVPREYLITLGGRKISSTASSSGFRQTLTGNRSCQNLDFSSPQREANLAA